MKAGIIAAGEGSRLREGGVAIPKPLVRVNGLPLLEHLLLQYHRVGVAEAYCIINEDSRAVEEYILGQKLPIPVRFHVKSTESSMHSLFELGRYLRETPFLLSTVDSIFDTVELAHFLESARRDRGDGLLAVTPYRGDEKPLWVRADTTGRITSFEKTGTGEQLVTGGLYFFSPRIFNEEAEAFRRGLSRLRNYLALLVEKNYVLHGYRFSKIVDLDHVEDISAAEEFLLERERALL
jgi:NDP-sugar pyrophosphorylase family protein